ncbi:hypothetical protein M9H77_17977 [Catharanthus roseus]|uniref:Uncharacterized protein n=1 Tax=Catharanthus roseus TaxID=4058 RepID=A0ACC0B666_CATRO|nr:hypothetical protein M9H77_17977 [Catharanthus roseus]
MAIFSGYEIAGQKDIKQLTGLIISFRWSEISNSRYSASGGLQLSSEFEGKNYRKISYRYGYTQTLPWTLEGQEYPKGLDPFTALPPANPRNLSAPSVSNHQLGHPSQ